MSPLDEELDAGAKSPSEDHRLSALEREVAELRAAVAELRGTERVAGVESAPVRRPPATLLDPRIAEALRNRERIPELEPRSDGVKNRAVRALGSLQLESLVGRYGTLALAALIILMAVGALIKMAVENGLITPEVRIVSGFVAAALLAAAGFWFRGRGDVRYGGVLLALSLAVIDLVAWGAGPRFHLLPTTVALSVVDVASLLLAALALHDESEFLFVIATAGALSAPFVTSTGGGTALSLLLYGGTVLVGGMRVARDADWRRAFAVLWLGAPVYALAAAALPMSQGWYGPYLVLLFAGACAASALAIGESGWRGELPRAYLAVAAIGTMVGWDAFASRPLPMTLAVSVGLAVLTHAVLLVRRRPHRYWMASALCLPFISLGVAYAGARGSLSVAAVIAAWGVMSLGAWQIERRRGEPARGSTHLLAAGVLGSLAVTTWAWDTPLYLVAGLAAWGVVVALMARDEESILPLFAVMLAEGSSALSALDQLASRSAYSYTPFTTRSSASALCAAAGLGLAGFALSRGRLGTVADRSVRMGSLIGFLILWGRMEVAQAFNHDVASFLLASYYAACGVASIVAGGRLEVPKLRMAGLGLALYAAFKAVVEVTDISSVLLRVGAYAAVGVFLLGAGYLYRDRGSDSLTV